MTCTRCGAEAVVKRDAAFYCGKCAMARDWEEIIAIVQDGVPTGGAVIDFGEASPVPPPAAVPANATAPVVPAAPPPAEQPAAAEPVHDSEPVSSHAPAAAVSSPSVTAAGGGTELPADPFG